MYAIRSYYVLHLLNEILDLSKIEAHRLRITSYNVCYTKLLRVSYALSDLAGEFSLPRFPSHEALSDAMQTAYLFLFLVRKLRDGGIVTLRDLFEAGRSWRWYF